MIKLMGKGLIIIRKDQFIRVSGLKINNTGLVRSSGWIIRNMKVVIKWE